MKCNGDVGKVCERTTAERAGERECVCVVCAHKREMRQRNEGEGEMRAVEDVELKSQQKRWHHTEEKS